MRKINMHIVSVIMKVKQFIFLLLLIFSFQESCMAMGEKDYRPQDTFAGKFETKCYDENLCMADQGVCFSKATILWDKELNKYYNLLMGKLKKQQRLDLQSAQIKWIKFRDAEIKSNQSIEKAFRAGSGFGVLTLDLTKQRALQLKDWYEWLKTVQ